MERLLPKDTKPPRNPAYMFTPEQIHIMLTTLVKFATVVVISTWTGVLLKIVWNFVALGLPTCMYMDLMTASGTEMTTPLFHWSAVKNVMKHQAP